MRISDWSSDVCSSDLFCVTQKVVDAHLMDDGRTIEEARADGYYSETGFTTEPRFFSGYPLNSGVYNMYANREMRFYASVGFNEAVWQALSSTETNKIGRASGRERG